MKKITGEQRVTITSEADFGSLQSTMEYLAYSFSDAGRAAGLSYAEWFDQSLTANQDKMSRAARIAGQNTLTAGSEGAKDAAKISGPQAGRDFVDNWSYGITDSLKDVNADGKAVTEEVKRGTGFGTVAYGAGTAVTQQVANGIKGNQAAAYYADAGASQSGTRAGLAYR